MPVYGKRSNEVRDTLHPHLKRVFDQVLKHYDHALLEGHRSEETHKKYVKQKRTRVPYSKTMHRFNPSRAVDATPWPIPDKWGDISWKERAKFYHFAGIVKATAFDMGINIRWGGDWNQNNDFDDQTFDDLVHFELR